MMQEIPQLHQREGIQEQVDAFNDVARAVSFHVRSLTPGSLAMLKSAVDRQIDFIRSRCAQTNLPLPAVLNQFFRAEMQQQQQQQHPHSPPPFDAVQQGRQQQFVEAQAAAPRPAIAVKLEDDNKASNFTLEQSFQVVLDLIYDHVAASPTRSVFLSAVGTIFKDQLATTGHRLIFLVRLDPRFELSPDNSKLSIAQR